MSDEYYNVVYYEDGDDSLNLEIVKNGSVPRIGEIVEIDIQPHVLKIRKAAGEKPDPLLSLANRELQVTKVKHLIKPHPNNTEGPINMVLVWVKLLGS